jgi:hypothetical protein
MLVIEALHGNDQQLVSVRVLCRNSWQLYIRITDTQRAAIRGRKNKKYTVYLVSPL